MKCGKKLAAADTQEYCRDCVRMPKLWKKGFTVWVYNETAQNSIAAFKYHNRREYAEAYADETVQAVGEELKMLMPAVFIPVPLHASRRLKRGYNQAEIYARAVGDRLGIPVRTDVLFRTKKTSAQKKLKKEQRFVNIADAFACSASPARVILVDDIYTTGSTMQACTQVLMNAGAREVYTLCMCAGEEG